MVGAYGFGVEPFWLRPVEYRVWHPSWPPDVGGFSIVQLSDLHGRTRAFSHPVARRWLQAADLIAVTGDLYSPTLPRERVATRLAALPPERTRYVSGNHDYRRRQLVIHPWQPAPEEVLDNRVERFGPEGLVLLGGVPDLVCGRVRWAEVRPPSGKCAAILLSHRPDAILAPGAAGYQLVLSGHTHGGQVALPGFGPILLHSRVGRGRTAGCVAWPDGRTLVVSRGLGTSELPVRFLARPEVVRVILDPAAAPEPRRGIPGAWGSRDTTRHDARHYPYVRKVRR